MTIQGLVDPIAQLAVELRTYLEIVSVEAPSEAAYGDTVFISILVRNKWTDRIFAIVTGSCDGIELSSDSHWIWPDAQRVFAFSFTMPNKSVNLWVWAWYWTATGWSEEPDDEYGPISISLPLPPVGWQLLDTAQVMVAVTAPPVVGWQLLDTATLAVKSTPPVPVGWQLLDTTTIAIKRGIFKGTIVRNELEYNGKQEPVPVADVPIGFHGLVHIWGRNDMATNQKLGLSWVVKDPEGNTIKEGIDWETAPPGYTGPGGQHHFIIPPGVMDYVDFGKLGVYTMSIKLLMNPDDPTAVATYDGDLCLVTMEVPPEYELVYEHTDPWAYFYEGDAETAIAYYTLPPEEFPFTDDMAMKIANGLVDKLEEAAPGSKLLEMKLYLDRAGPLWSRWRIEVTASVPAVGYAVPFVIPWPLIIKGVLIVVVVALIYFIVKSIVSVFFRKKALSEEVKVKWKRDTLISMITDLRPAYSPEELEEMSDQELRDVLNEIYKEEVPPVGLKWWQWAIIGGLGIAGGALALKYFRTIWPKKEEKK